MQGRDDEAAALQELNAGIYQNVYEDAELVNVIMQAQAGVLHAIAGRVDAATKDCNQALARAPEWPDQARVFELLRQDCTRYVQRYRARTE